MALLSVAGSRGLSRERLGYLLWPDAASDKTARRLLSDSIYRINQAVGGDVIVAAGEAVRLDMERLTSDVADFAEAISQELWERAVELQHAPFLDGFVLPSAPFEQWLESERRRLHRDRQTALEALATAAGPTDPKAATQWWRQLAAGDPFSSRVAIGLMRALDAQGDRAAAVQHALTHTSWVREELGLEPDPGVAQYAEELRDAPTRAIANQMEPDQSEIRSPAPRAIDPAKRAALAAPPDQTRVAPPLANHQRRGFPLPLAVAGVALASVVAIGILSISGPPPEITEAAASSVVVLPFADNSPDADQEYFADGMTDELIARLSAVEGLRVVARTSAFAFKGRAIDVREVGRQLGVGAVLEGSVRRVGDRLRVSAQLVDARNGFEMWSETYERPMNDVLDIQGDIASGIVDRMTGAVMPAAPLASLSTEDAEAFSLYLSGRFEWHKRSSQGLTRAAELLEAAVDQAPGFARAHAGLADAYAVLGFYDYLAPSDAFPKAKAGALRATELDAQLAEPQATLGYAALYYDWDAIEAERRFRSAISLNPGYSTGHQWYANLLVASARFEEAEREMQRAQELDPLSRIASAALGFVHYHAGEYDRARNELERTLTLDPEFEVAHLWTGWVLEEERRYAEAVSSYERAVALSGSAISRAALARGLVLSGDEARARDLLTQLESQAERGYAPSYEIAKVHEALGDRRAALVTLRRAFDERSHSMVFLAIDPQLRTLRADPEFGALLNQVPIARLARERLGW